MADGPAQQASAVKFIKYITSFAFNSP